jgi:CBS domain-containing protein
MLVVVENIMSSGVIVVYPSDTVAHARNLMIKHKIARLVVIDSNHHPIGIVTKTDLATKLEQKGPIWKMRPIDQYLVNEVMTTDPTLVGVKTPVKMVAEMMLKKGVSGFPVIDKSKRLTGIITKSDLTRFCAEKYNGKVKVKDWMSNNLIAVDRMHTISHIISLMNRKSIHRVVVVDGTYKPVGIITASDIAFSKITGPKTGLRIRKVERGLKRRPDVEDFGKRAMETIQVAEDLMSSPLLTINENNSIREAAALMLKNRISGLPVVNKSGDLTGIITKTDIVKFVAMAMPDES